MKQEGKIFDIVRSSLHDGNGIRTVVYFKGCSLNCVWCHDPEGISGRNEIMYYDEKCIGCGRCVKCCPDHHNDNGYDRTGCTACGKCAEVCPNDALTICGRMYDVDTLYREIIKDKHYYDMSGGGVTFSGGECFLQPEFLYLIASKCKESGINTAVETALNFDHSYLKDTINVIDSIMLDIKHMDTNAHKLYTGSGNEIILDNIRWLSNNHNDITIRIPMIPNVNDSESNLIETAKFIDSCGNGIKKLELLKYNNLAVNKYKALGRMYTKLTAEPQSDELMDYYKNVMSSYINQ